MPRLFRASTAVYLDIGDAAPFNPAGSFTISCWVRPYSLGADTDVLTKWQGAASRSWLLSIGTDREFDWNILGANSVGYGGTVPGYKLRPGVWTHLAGTYKIPTSGYVQAFADGVAGAQTAVADAATSIFNSTLATQVGKRSDNGGGELFGEVADIATWDSVLSQGEIRALAAGASPLSLPRGTLSSNYPIHADLFNWDDLSATSWTANGAVYVTPPRPVLIPTRVPSLAAAAASVVGEAVARWLPRRSRQTSW